MTDPRLIFTVTAGRTGSQFVAALIDTLDGVIGAHEPEPNLGRYVRTAQVQPEVICAFLSRDKLPAIRRTGAGVYAETSNMFAKGFLEPALALGWRPGLLFLDRHPRQIALSHLKAVCLPGTSPTGTTALLMPSDPNVLPFPGWERVHPYQLCFWYALEMERRHHRYEEIARALGLPWFRTTARDLHDRDRFAALCAAFDLPAPDAAAHERVCATRFNVQDFLDDQDLPANLDELEAQVWRAAAFHDPLLRPRLAAKWRTV